MLTPRPTDPPDPPPTATAEPLISVLIVDYAAGCHLDRCLAALAAQRDEDFEVLLLDNASPVHAPTIPDTLAPRMTRLRSETNLGFAGGNNRAAAAARGTWLALLNPDAFPDPDWTESLRAAIARYPGAVMLGSTQLLEDAPDRLDGAGDCLHALCYAWRGGRGRPAADVDGDSRSFGPCAAAALVRRDAFDAIGGFEQRFFCYYEDVDLAFRLRLAGHVAVQLSAARVRHVGSATTGAGSDFVRYHVTRNRIWMFVRCMPGPLFWALLPPFTALTALRLLLSPAIGDAGVRWRAVRDALAAAGWAWRDRNRIQRARSASWLAIARSLAWSPRRLIDSRRDGRAPEPAASEARP